MKLELGNEKSVHKTDCGAYDYNREEHDDQRHRVKTLEHLVRIIAHLEQRSSNTSRESDAAAGGNIGTGQHYASRNAQSDRQFCRRERDYVHY